MEKKKQRIDYKWFSILKQNFFREKINRLTIRLLYVGIFNYRQNQQEKHLKLFTNSVTILKAVFLINYLCDKDFFLKVEDNK